MKTTLFRNGSIILPEAILSPGCVLVGDGNILAIGAELIPGLETEVVDLHEGYLSPGFVDLHVHGGAGFDFMDSTTEAFHAVCRVHLRHGTTSLLPTTTVARHDQHLAFLNICRALKRTGTEGARILGAHFYGPYFAPEAKGCHSGTTLRPPVESEYAAYLEFADCITRATVAPELTGAESFANACRSKKIGCNAGHSYATFSQMELARGWGITHVDHLFCAMSDRARLRQSQVYPMRGGVMEATLYFDDLTTEVIADGKHLSHELLRLAYKIKGPDALALVTDCNRALDMPDGPYLFGPTDGGEPILKRDGVGVMPDGLSLASGVLGMDDCVRTMLQLTGRPLYDVVRMASLTPARIAGWDTKLGSIEAGKWADLLVLDSGLRIQSVYLQGKLMSNGESQIGCSRS